MQVVSPLLYLLILVPVLILLAIGLAVCLRRRKRRQSPDDLPKRRSEYGLSPLTSAPMPGTDYDVVPPLSTAPPIVSPESNYGEAPPTLNPASNYGAAPPTLRMNEYGAAPPSAQPLP